MLIFRLIITNFGTLRMHQFYQKFSRESMHPDPPSTSGNQQSHKATYASGMYLIRYCFFIKF